MATPPAGTNGKATASLVLGILSLFCCGFITGIAAIILGKQAQRETAISGQNGAGLAQAGFILGIIGTVLSVLAAVMWLILIAVGSA